ncbi:hypothetical protein B9G55_21090 [Saccharibacillus sp. O16]|nr:hypothetical protein B9G55_21090 [Saccharibacillus sp. O16]
MRNSRPPAISLYSQIYCLCTIKNYIIPITFIPFVLRYTERVNGHAHLKEELFLKKKRIAFSLAAYLLAASVVLPIAPHTVLAASSDTSVITNITRALEQKKTSFTLQMSSSQAERVLSLIDSAITKAEPYARYTVDQFEMSTETSGNQATVTFSASYLENKQQADYVTAQVKATLKSIIKPGMTSEDKIKAIHDYIVAKFAYDESLTRYSAYDGLTEGTTVCQGYALLGYRMLNLAGIETKIVEGYAGGDLHVWNKVKLNGNWYNIDLTWDDPTPDRKGEVSYGYYMVTDKLLARDHTWKQKDYPAAATDYRAQLVQKSASNAASRSLLNAIGGEITSTKMTLQKKVLSAVNSKKTTLTLTHDFGSSQPDSLIEQVLNSLSGTSVQQYQYGYQIADNGIATVQFTFVY